MSPAPLRKLLAILISALLLPWQEPARLYAQTYPSLKSPARTSLDALLKDSNAHLADLKNAALTQAKADALATPDAFAKDAEKLRAWKDANTAETALIAEAEGSRALAQDLADAALARVRSLLVKNGLWAALIAKPLPAITAQEWDDIGKAIPFILGDMDALKTDFTTGAAFQTAQKVRARPVQAKADADFLAIHDQLKKEFEKLDADILALNLKARLDNLVTLKAQSLAVNHQMAAYANGMQIDGKAVDLTATMQTLGSLYENAGKGAADARLQASADFTQFGVWTANGQAKVTQGPDASIVFSNVPKLTDQGIKIPAPTAAAAPAKQAGWRDAMQTWLDMGKPAWDAFAAGAGAELTGWGLVAGIIPPVLPGMNALGLGGTGLAKLASGLVAAGTQDSFERAFNELPARLDAFEAKLKAAKARADLPAAAELEAIRALLDQALKSPYLAGLPADQKAAKTATLNALKTRFAQMEAEFNRRTSLSTPLAAELLKTYNGIINDITVCISSAPYLYAVPPPSAAALAKFETDRKALTERILRKKTVKSGVTGTGLWDWTVQASPLVLTEDDKDLQGPRARAETLVKLLQGMEGKDITKLPPEQRQTLILGDIAKTSSPAGLGLLGQSWVKGIEDADARALRTAGFLERLDGLQLTGDFQADKLKLDGFFDAELQADKDLLVHVNMPPGYAAYLAAREAEKKNVPLEPGAPTLEQSYLAIQVDARARANLKTANAATREKNALFYSLFDLNRQAYDYLGCGTGRKLTEEDGKYITQAAADDFCAGFAGAKTLPDPIASKDIYAQQALARKIQKLLDNLPEVLANKKLEESTRKMWDSLRNMDPKVKEDLRVNGGVDVDKLLADESKKELIQWAIAAYEMGLSKEPEKWAQLRDEILVNIDPQFKMTTSAQSDALRLELKKPDPSSANLAVTLDGMVNPGLITRGFAEMIPALTDPAKIASLTARERDLLQAWQGDGKAGSASYEQSLKGFLLALASQLEAGDEEAVRYAKLIRAGVADAEKPGKADSLLRAVRVAGIFVNDPRAFVWDKQTLDVGMNTAALKRPPQTDAERQAYTVADQEKFETLLMLMKHYDIKSDPWTPQGAAEIRAKLLAELGDGVAKSQENRRRDDLLFGMDQQFKDQIHKASVYVDGKTALMSQDAALRKSRAYQQLLKFGKALDAYELADANAVIVNYNARNTAAGRARVDLATAYTTMKVADEAYFQHAPEGWVDWARTKQRTYHFTGFVEAKSYKEAQAACRGTTSDFCTQVAKLPLESAEADFTVLLENLKERSGYVTLGGRDKTFVGMGKERYTETLRAGTFDKDPTCRHATELVQYKTLDKTGKVKYETLRFDPKATGQTPRYYEIIALEPGEGSGKDYNDTDKTVWVRRAVAVDDPKNKIFSLNTVIMTSGGSRTSSAVTTILTTTSDGVVSYKKCYGGPDCKGNSVTVDLLTNGLTVADPLTSTSFTLKPDNSTLTKDASYQQFSLGERNPDGTITSHPPVFVKSGRYEVTETPWRFFDKGAPATHFKPVVATPNLEAEKKGVVLRTGWEMRDSQGRDIDKMSDLDRFKLILGKPLDANDKGAGLVKDESLVEIKDDAGEIVAYRPRIASLQTSVMHQNPDGTQRTADEIAQSYKAMTALLMGPPYTVEDPRDKAAHDAWALSQSQPQAVFDYSGMGVSAPPTPTEPFVRRYNMLLGGFVDPALVYDTDEAQMRTSTKDMSHEEEFTRWAMSFDGAAAYGLSVVGHETLGTPTFNFSAGGGFQVSQRTLSQGKTCAGKTCVEGLIVTDKTTIGQIMPEPQGVPRMWDDTPPQEVTDPIKQGQLMWQWGAVDGQKMLYVVYDPESLGEGKTPKLLGYMGCYLPDDPNCKLYGLQTDVASGEVYDAEHNDDKDCLFGLVDGHVYNQRLAVCKGGKCSYDAAYAPVVDETTGLGNYASQLGGYLGTTFRYHSGLDPDGFAATFIGGAIAGLCELVSFDNLFLTVATLGAGAWAKGALTVGSKLIQAGEAATFTYKAAVTTQKGLQLFNVGMMGMAVHGLNDTVGLIHEAYVTGDPDKIYEASRAGTSFVSQMVVGVWIHGKLNPESIKTTKGSKGEVNIETTGKGDAVVEQAPVEHTAPDPSAPRGERTAPSEHTAPVESRTFSEHAAPDARTMPGERISSREMNIDPGGLKGGKGAGAEGFAGQGTGTQFFGGGKGGRSGVEVRPDAVTAGKGGKGGKSDGFSGEGTGTEFFSEGKSGAEAKLAKAEGEHAAAVSDAAAKEVVAKDAQARAETAKLAAEKARAKGEPNPVLENRASATAEIAARTADAHGKALAEAAAKGSRVKELAASDIAAKQTKAADLKSKAALAEKTALDAKAKGDPKAGELELKSKSAKEAADKADGEHHESLKNESARKTRAKELADKPAPDRVKAADKLAKTKEKEASKLGDKAALEEAARTKQEASAAKSQAKEAKASADKLTKESSAARKKAAAEKDPTVKAELEAKADALESRAKDARAQAEGLSLKAEVAAKTASAAAEAAPPTTFLGKAVQAYQSGFDFGGRATRLGERMAASPSKFWSKTGLPQALDAVSAFGGKLSAKFDASFPGMSKAIKTASQPAGKVLSEGRSVVKGIGFEVENVGKGINKAFDLPRRGLGLLGQATGLKFLKRFEVRYDKVTGERVEPVLEDGKPVMREVVDPLTGARTLEPVMRPVAPGMVAGMFSVMFLEAGALLQGRVTPLGASHKLAAEDILQPDITQRADFIALAKKNNGEVTGRLDLTTGELVFGAKGPLPKGMADVHFKTATDGTLADFKIEVRPDAAAGPTARADLEALARQKLDSRLEASFGASKQHAALTRTLRGPEAQDALLQNRDPLTGASHVDLYYDVSLRTYQVGTKEGAPLVRLSVETVEGGAYRIVGLEKTGGASLPLGAEYALGKYLAEPRLIAARTLASPEGPSQKPFVEPALVEGALRSAEGDSRQATREEAADLLRGGRVPFKPVKTPSVTAFDALRPARVETLTRRGVETALEPQLQAAKAEALLAQDFPDGLTPKMRAAVEKAHLVGRGELGKDGVRRAERDNYTTNHLLAKAHILQEAGFTFKQIDVLVRNGVVGDPASLIPTHPDSFGGKHPELIDAIEALMQFIPDLKKISAENPGTTMRQLLDVIVKSRQEAAAYLGKLADAHPDAEVAGYLRKFAEDINPIDKQLVDIEKKLKSIVMDETGSPLIYGEQVIGKTATEAQRKELNNYMSKLTGAAGELWTLIRVEGVIESGMIIEKHPLFDDAAKQRFEAEKLRPGTEIDFVFEHGKAWGEVKNYEGVMDLATLEKIPPKVKGKGQNKSILMQAQTTPKILKALGLEGKIKLHHFFKNGITKEAAAKLEALGIEVHGIVDAPPSIEVVPQTGPRPPPEPSGFLTPAEILKKFGGVDPTTLKGPTLGGLGGGTARLIEIGGEKWVIKTHQAGGHLLTPEMRADRLAGYKTRAENELLMREVVRKLFPEFETPEALAYQDGDKVVIMSRYAEGAKPDGAAFESLTPDQRVKLSILTEVFGLSDVNWGNILFGKDKPVLIDFENVSRSAQKGKVDPEIVAIVIRTGHAPFIDRTTYNEPGLYKAEHARWVERFKEPSFSKELLASFEKAGLTPEAAKAYLESIKTNLENYQANLKPYLEAVNAKHPKPAAPDPFDPRGKPLKPSPIGKDEMALLTPEKTLKLKLPIGAVEVWLGEGREPLQLTRRKDGSVLAEFEGKSSLIPADGFLEIGPWQQVSGAQFIAADPSLGSRGLLLKVESDGVRLRNIGQTRVLTPTKLSLTAQVVRSVFARAKIYLQYSPIGRFFFSDAGFHHYIARAKGRIISRLETRELELHSKNPENVVGDLSAELIDVQKHSDCAVRAAYNHPALAPVREVLDYETFLDIAEGATYSRLREKGTYHDEKAQFLRALGYDFEGYFQPPLESHLLETLRQDGAVFATLAWNKARLRALFEGSQVFNGHAVVINGAVRVDGVWKYVVTDSNFRTRQLYTWKQLQKFGLAISRAYPMKVLEGTSFREQTSAELKELARKALAQYRSVVVPKPSAKDLAYVPWVKLEPKSPAVLDPTQPVSIELGGKGGLILQTSTLADFIAKHPGHIGDAYAQARGVVVFDSLNPNRWLFLAEGRGVFVGSDWTHSFVMPRGVGPKHLYLKLTAAGLELNAGGTGTTRIAGKRAETQGAKAEKLLSKDFPKGLPPRLQEAVERAHLVGQGMLGKDGVNPAARGNYTKAHLLEKARILSEAGFKPEQIRSLMEAGIVGLPPKILGPQTQKLLNEALAKFAKTLAPLIPSRKIAIKGWIKSLLDPPHGRFGEVYRVETAAGPRAVKVPLKSRRGQDGVLLNEAELVRELPPKFFDPSMASDLPIPGNVNLPKFLEYGRLELDSLLPKRSLWNRLRSKLGLSERVEALETDWVDGSTLKDFLKTGGKIERADWRGLMDAISRLHALDYYHGDLSLENIMVSRDAASGRTIFTLIDFGKAGKRTEGALFGQKVSEDLLMLETIQGELVRQKALLDEPSPFPEEPKTGGGPR